MLISVPTPCSSRVFKFVEHDAGVVPGRNFVTTCSKSMLATHVDDMLWATKSGCEDRLHIFWTVIKTVESGACGREVIQHSDFSVSVKCKTRPRRLNMCSSLGCKAMQASAFIRCEQVAVCVWNCDT